MKIIGSLLTRWSTPGGSGGDALRPAVVLVEAERPAPLRGRVHKVSIVAGGEVSVVVRFGIDEPRARELNQGRLLEVFEAPPATPPTEG